MTSDLRKLGKSSFVYVLQSILARSGKLLLIPVYVRFLTLPEVGMVVWLEAITVALGRFLSFGLGQAIKRFYVEFEDEREADAFAATIFWIGVLLATAVGAVLALAAWHYTPLITTQIAPKLVVLAVVGGILQSNYSAPMQRFIARQEPSKFGMFELLQFTLSATLVIYFVAVRRMGVEGVLWGQVIAGAVWNIVAAVLMTRAARGRLHWARMSESFAYALPALPHLLFTWGLSFADRPILERFVPLAALGIYGVGYQLASIMPVLTNSILNSWITPFFKTAGQEQGPREYARVFTYVVSALLMVALMIIVFAPEGIAVFARPEYAESANILRLVTLGLIFNGTYQALLLVLFFIKKTQWVSIATGTAFVTNIGMNLLLIPVIGIYGAALATITAYLVATIVTFIAARRFYQLELEYARLATVAVAFATIAALAVLIPAEWAWWGTGLKVVIMLACAIAVLRYTKIRIPGRFRRGGRPRVNEEQVT